MLQIFKVRIIIMIKLITSTHIFRPNHPILFSLSNINSSFCTKSSSEGIGYQIKSIHESSKSPIYNLTPKIIELCDKKLLHVDDHPLTIIKNKIIEFFGPSYNVSDNLNPIVSTQNNFDVLNIEPDHVSRKQTDTYYITPETLLRTHTSAHQKDKLTAGLKDFIVFGDVYRRDQIDRYHYPVFHQMQAVSMLGKKGQISVQDIESHLKKKLEDLAVFLFGKCQMRWVDAYFPFTEPSFQLQVFFDGKWVEMLGCGVIQKRVLQRSGRGDEVGWAAGLGLQRFAMRLFKIPDVRLFWSKDPRFIQQFEKGKITEFKEFSKYPVCMKDISMWIKEQYNANDLYGIIRQIGGDLIESVQQIDTFTNKKTGKTSKAYRINFRSLQRTLENQEIVKYQFAIRDAIKQQLKSVELR